MVRISGAANAIGDAAISGEALLIIDVDGIIRFADSRAEELLGQPAASLVGNWFGVPESGKGEIEISAGVARKHARLARIKAVRAILNGTPVYIASLYETGAPDDGMPAPREPENADVIAEFSHELRTPLNAIVGFADMIREETYGPLGHAKYGEYVSDIRECGLYLLRLLNSVLDLSKADAGMLELKVSTIDISSAAAECVQLISANALEKSLSVRQRVPQFRIRVDPLKFRQVLLNLLSNAVKFTPPGGRVEFSARLLKTGAVRLRIADTGIGMDEDQLANLFTPYRQVHLHGAVPDAQDGTGLGLALSKRYVQLHGGTISVESEPGRGTTVSITLPADRVVRPRRPTVH